MPCDPRDMGWTRHARLAYHRPVGERTILHPHLVTAGDLHQTGSRTMPRRHSCRRSLAPTRFLQRRLLYRFGFATPAPVRGLGLMRGRRPIFGKSEAEKEASLEESS